MSMRHQQALADPFSVYDDAKAVLDDETLPTAAKLQVLSAMEMDIAAREVAESENMPGDEELAQRHSEVRDAIIRLDPGAEAHGEVERERRIDLRHEGTVLTTEQARQAEVVLRTRRQRRLFLGIAAGGLAVFAVVVLLTAG